MKRALKVGMGVVTAAAVALPALALAQGFPPDPPSTYYGTVAGGTVGQGVVAIVQSGNSSQTCGVGSVISDNGNTVYVVDVFHDSQTDGCGQTGRTIRFYLTPVGSTPGRLANETVNWSAAGAPKEQNLTLGASLNIKGRLPTIARDGIPF